MFDLKAVVSFLQKATSESVELILWGRSMGAVTAIRYISQYGGRNVRVAILDSPFLSLRSLIVESVNERLGIPKFLVEIFLKYL